MGLCLWRTNHRLNPVSHDGGSAAVAHSPSAAVWGSGGDFQKRQDRYETQWWQTSAVGIFKTFALILFNHIVAAWTTSRGTNEHAGKTLTRRVIREYCGTLLHIISTSPASALTRRPAHKVLFKNSTPK